MPSEGFEQRNLVEGGRAALEAKAGCRKGGVFGKAFDIDADTQDQPIEAARRRALAFQQDPGGLAVIDQDIVGPLVPDLDHGRHDRADGIAHPQRGHEAELCCLRRAAIRPQDQGEIKVAAGALPGAASTAAALELLTGPDQSPVFGAGFGELPCFVIGAGDAVACNETIGRR